MNRMSSMGPKRRFEMVKSSGPGLALLLALALAGCSASLADMEGSVTSAGGLLASAPRGRPLPIEIFVASTRRGEPPDAGEAATEDGAHFAFDIVSVPPGHRPGVIETPTFGSAQASRHFVLASERPLDPDEFGNEVATSISGRIGANRDILLYVHGFNTSLQDARFRLAQVVADARFGGVPVLFTWPSQKSLFSYVSDKDRATASRDALEALMLNLSQVPGIGRIDILAHSMGTWLTMEALRENAIAGHPDLNGRLGDVMLAAPDIDLAVFKQQMARLGEATHVSIFVSSADRALSLSSRIAGDQPRVGALNPNDPRERAELEKLGVKVYDLSSISDGFIGHDTFADAPQVIRTIGAQLNEPRKEDAKVMALTDAGVAVPPPDVSAAAPAAPGAASGSDSTGTITATPLPPPAPAIPDAAETSGEAPRN